MHSRHNMCMLSASHLTSGASICPKNTQWVTKVKIFFSETASLQQSYNTSCIVQLLKWCKLCGNAKDAGAVLILVNGVYSFFDREFTVAMVRAHTLKERGALCGWNLANGTFSVPKE